MALPGRRGRVLLLTTDAVVAGSHFPPGAPGRWVGRFAAQVNLSDLAAKGGRPSGFLCALQVPPRSPARWSRGVVNGILEEGRRVGVPLLGGDTKASPTPTVTLLALGEGRRGQLMPRDGGHAGDLLVTTGTVGTGGARFVRWRASGNPRGPTLRRLLTVRPRLEEGQVLRRYARAAMDTSDGLLRSVRLLARASRLSATVDLRKLPFSPECLQAAEQRGVPVERIAFLGGDYELLVALPESRWAAARAGVRDVDGELSVVGRLSNGNQDHLLTEHGLQPLPDVGWDSFSQGPSPRAWRRGGPLGRASPR